MRGAVIVTLWVWQVLLALGVLGEGCLQNGFSFSCAEGRFPVWGSGPCDNYPTAAVVADICVCTGNIYAGFGGWPRWSFAGGWISFKAFLVITEAATSSAGLG